MENQEHEGNDEAPRIRGPHLPAIGMTLVLAISLAAIIIFVPAAAAWPLTIALALLSLWWSHRRMKISRLRVGLCMAATEGNFNKVMELLGRGAPVDAIEGCHPLFVACAEGREEIVKAFLDRGADPNVPAHDSPPLFAASLRGHTETVKLLLENDADVAATCKNDAVPEDLRNGTALHAAACGGHKEVVKLLLEHGADRQAKSITEKTPLDIANDNNQSQSVELLE